MQEKTNIPEHVAIIMDGNGRWAKDRDLPSAMGHKKGAETARTLIETADKLGIKYLTLYAFSSENWNRPKEEVTNLMKLFRHYIEKENKNLSKSNIRILVIGNLDRLPDDLKVSIKKAVESTSSNSGMTLIIALSYGGREEILHATKNILNLYKEGKLEENELTEQLFSSNLYTACIPDPDLLIRTSGEVRISNFLLWQSAYTEFYFTQTNWPDFTPKEFELALLNFQTRKRNYGK